MGTLLHPKTGDETNRGDGTRHGTGEDFLENRGLIVYLDVNTQ